MQTSLPSLVPAFAARCAALGTGVLIRMPHNCVPPHDRLCGPPDPSRPTRHPPHTYTRTHTARAPTHTSTHGHISSTASSCSPAFRGEQLQSGEEPPEERLAFSLADGRAGVLAIRGRRISDTRPRRPSWHPLASGGAAYGGGRDGGQRVRGARPCPWSAHSWFHGERRHLTGAVVPMPAPVFCGQCRCAANACFCPCWRHMPPCACRLQGGGHWLLGLLPAAGRC